MASFPTAKIGTIEVQISPETRESIAKLTEAFRRVVEGAAQFAEDVNKMFEEIDLHAVQKPSEPSVPTAKCVHCNETIRYIRGVYAYTDTWRHERIEPGTGEYHRPQSCQFTVGRVRTEATPA